MRNCKTAGFRLLAASAAALMIVKTPLPAFATTEVATGQIAPAQPAVAAPPTTPAAAGQPPAPAATSADTTATSAAEPAKPKPPAPTLVARINLTTQTMVVQEGNKTVHSWKVSTGAAGYATPAGTFKPGWMSKLWHSRQYDDAPMPFSVFFNGGIAVHGTMAPSSIGRAASHGCVRLHTANAERFYKLVSRHGMAQTRIVVHGAQPFSHRENIAGRSGKRGSTRSASARSGSDWVYSSADRAAPRGIGRDGRRDSYGYTPQQRRVSSATWARY